MAAALNLTPEQLEIPRHLRARLDGPTGRRLAALRLVDEPTSTRRAVPASRVDAAARPEVGSRTARRPAPARTRLAPLVVLACAVVVALAAAIPALSVDPGPAGSEAVGGTTMTPVSAQVYVVQPGDTLWGIANSVAPGSDPRPLVDALAAQVGPSGLQPGQQLRLGAIGS
jgi:hypothetical protein